jgi:hypothetical protein
MPQDYFSGFLFITTHTGRFGRCSYRFLLKFRAVSAAAAPSPAFWFPVPLKTVYLQLRAKLMCGGIWLIPARNLNYK